MMINQCCHSIAQSVGAADRAVYRLNAVDRAMRAVDRALRWMGYPGFDTQLLLWLSERLDVSLLRESLNRLAMVEPLIISRLEEQRHGGPVWLANGAQVGLIETTLSSDTEEAILDFAAEQLATPADPVGRNPIRFYLIHRAEAPDVLLIQYNHTLMDNRGSLEIVRQIKQLAVTDGRELPQVDRPADDPIRRYLLRYSTAHRRAAADRALDVWWRAIKGGAATLGQPQQRVSQQRVRVRSTRLTTEQTLALRARAVAVCGFPAISMNILGAAFRCSTDWPLHAAATDLGLRVSALISVCGGPAGSALHNLMSIVPIRIESAEVCCRERSLLLLNKQMRDHLASEVDLGILQLMRVFARKPHQMDWAVDHCLAHGFSLWYAYFGLRDEIGQEFLGVPVDNVSYFGPCWSPIGITLLAQEYRGRLGLQLTYLPELVSEPDANSFLALTALICWMIRSD